MGNKLLKNQCNTNTEKPVSSSASTDSQLVSHQTSTTANNIKNFRLFDGVIYSLISLHCCRAGRGKNKQPAQISQFDHIHAAKANQDSYDSYVGNVENTDGIGHLRRAHLRMKFTTKVMSDSKGVYTLTFCGAASSQCYNLLNVIAVGQGYTLLIDLTSLLTNSILSIKAHHILLI